MQPSMANTRVYPLLLGENLSSFGFLGNHGQKNNRQVVPSPWNWKSVGKVMKLVLPRSLVKNVDKRPKQNGLIRHCDKMKKESHQKKHPDFGEVLLWSIPSRFNLANHGSPPSTFSHGIGIQPRFCFFLSHLNTLIFTNWKSLVKKT